MPARRLELAGLLLDLPEQPRVLDGDGRLRREGLQQADRVLGKGADALAPHHERADQLVLMHERHGEQRAHAGLQVQIEQRVRRRLGQIVDLHRLAALGALADQGVAQPDRMLAHGRDQVFAHPVAGLQVELAAHRVVHVDRAAAGVGELAGVGQDGIQNRPQVERRADRAADLAERLQLAHRARQLARPLLDLAFEVRVGLLQLPRHLIEVLGERLQLVAGPDIDAAASGRPGRSGWRPPASARIGPARLRTYARRKP